MLFSNGLIFVGAVVAFFALYHYQKETGRKMKWWKWVLSVLWVTVLFMSSGVLGTFAGEGEPQAVLPGMLFFGIIVLVTGVVLFRLLFSETFLPVKKKETPVKETEKATVGS